MGVIIRVEEVHNAYGNLVKLVYHYEDGSKNEREVFISAKELERMESIKKRWLGSKC